MCIYDLDVCRETLISEVQKIYYRTLLIDTSFSSQFYMNQEKEMYFSAAGSTWHRINYFLFCWSLLGNTLHSEIKESNSTEVAKWKLTETFLAPVLCFDKYQRRIQNPVDFNSFKPLTISARSYFLEAWLVLSTNLNTTIWIDLIGVFCFIFLLVGIC